MTEAILLPGTEMEVIEKYPLSRRLDHPDFGDVCKTTFAKGVITEFKMMKKANCDPLFNYPDKSVGTDQVDPFRVKSMVKVEIGGNESDWLPLFYHPKALMWDDEDMVVSNDDGDEFTVDEGVLATDFQAEADEDGDMGYFKKAWMSFRPQDEVAVMLKEGVPVAVLGHADGVPRVGEAVFKVTVQNSGPSESGLTGPEEERIVRMDLINILPSDVGPDGLVLQLVNELIDPDGSHSSALICDNSNESYQENDTDPNNITWLRQWSRLKEWMIIVGPIMYILSQFSSWEQAGWNEEVGLISLPSPMNYIYASLATPENVEKAEALGTQHAGLTMLGPYLTWDGYTGYTPDTSLFASFWINDGFYRQSDLTVFGTTGNLNTLYYKYPVPPDFNIFSSVFTRPHTKAELQTAGMWPAA